MTYLKSAVVFLAIGWHLFAEGRPEKEGVRFANTTYSTGSSSQSKYSSPSSSDIEPLLTPNLSVVPMTTAPTPLSPPMGGDFPAVSQSATQNRTSTRLSFSTTNFPEDSTPLFRKSRSPVITTLGSLSLMPVHSGPPPTSNFQYTAQSFGRNKSETSTSFTTTNLPQNATSISSERRSPITTTRHTLPFPKRCHTYHPEETATFYTLVTVTVSQLSNFTHVPFPGRAMTLPMQPCIENHNGSHPVGIKPNTLWYFTRTTLKTTITVPGSEIPAASSYPQPAIKITITPVATPTVPPPRPQDANDSSLPANPTAISVIAPATSTLVAPTLTALTGSDALEVGVPSLTFKEIPLHTLLQPYPATTEVTVGGVPLDLSPSSVNIGRQQFGNDLSNIPVTVGSQTFTINPSEVIGPKTTIRRPQIVGALFTPTTIAGVPLAIGPSVAVIGGLTFAIGPGAAPQTIQIGGQTISVGSDGLGFLQTTAPPAPPSSYPTIVGGITVTAIGSSEAVADGTTFKFSSGSVPQTYVINGQTITIGPSGVVLASTTIGGPSNSGSTQVVTQGSLQISQVGPNFVAIQGTTYNITPGSSPVTDIIEGQKVSIGPNGVGVGSTIIHAPFAAPTSVVIAGGITVQESGTLALIAGKTFTIGPDSGTTTASFNGQEITIGPNGVVVGGTTIPRPQNPSASVVFTAAAVTVSEIGSTLAIIGQETFTVGPQAKSTYVVQNGQTISIGPNGIAIGSTTIKAPFSPPPTSVITAGRVTFSEVGSTLAVIDGTTFTVGPQAVQTIETFEGETIRIGKSGLVIGSSTITAPFVTPETNIVTIGRITLSEIGSTLAVIAGSTFTIGPNAPQTTEVIDGQSISLGPGGIGFASTTISYVPTQAVTAGGITFTEVGSTLAVIGGSTFTIGPGAEPMTKTYDGQTISLGPGGIGFKMTTLSSFATSSTASSMASPEAAHVTPQTKKNGGSEANNVMWWGAGVSLVAMWLM